MRSLLQLPRAQRRKEMGIGTHSPSQSSGEERRKSVPCMPRRLGDREEAETNRGTWQRNWSILQEMRQFLREAL